MRVLVSNPSSNPEMAHAASALARRGALAGYHVPVAVGQRALRALEHIPWVAGPVVREARRRPRPPFVVRSSVRRTATCSDLVRVAATRSPLPPIAQSNVAEGHRRRFDAAVAAQLGGSENKVVAVEGSALATLRRARELGIEAVLDATLAHPRFVSRLIEHEVQTAGRPAAELGVEILPRGFTERRVAELELADRILVPSSFARRTHVAEGIHPARMDVLPLGVDTDLFSPRASPSVREQPFRVLFVGRLTRLKGVPNLIRAFASAAIPDSELILVGDSAFADPSWLSQPGVRHQAPLPRYLLASIFQRADVFVMPSLAESYGLVILEAMASGVPVIVSANSIGPDVVDEGITGYIVPAGDSDTLAERLLTLARDTGLRDRMGRAAAASAKRFSWSAYESEFVASLDD